MANQTLLSMIYSQVVPNSWEGACIANLNASSFFNHSNGLVNGQGETVSSLTDATWGITIEACKNHCNHNQIPFIFNFQSFSSSMTNYFLPWLALTAQLPFETGDFLSNGMAFCLAVGSPALVTYSLVITILNRYWVRKRFNGLISKARGLSVRQKFSELESRVRTSQYLLQEAQQVPLRASQQQGWFSSLIVIPDNFDWWAHLERSLRNTRRGVTASLVAQMLFAAIAYLFTVMSSFDTELGDPSTALQIASGSLWIWLIPIIGGWITVGTQYSHHSIEDALEAEGAVRALEPPTQPGHEYADPIEQPGLVVRPGLTPQQHRLQTVVGAFDVPELAHLELPTWFGADVGGDEQRKGPIYNYARLFTWWQLASSMDRALFKTMDNISNNRACPVSLGPFRAWDSNVSKEENMLGDSGGTAKYCGLETQPILAYPKWADIPPEIYRRIAAASVVVLFLQWGTSGASILIAYLTPTIGLGCRSGSYLLYGILGTVSWLCLLSSMALSHNVMLLYQAEHVRNPSTDFRSRANQYTRGWWHAFVCAAAVSLRYLGRFLAFGNTLWLIASSLMEFTGGYDNCWCKGNYIGMGDDGWIVLFKGATDLAAKARLPWYGGLALTLVVCSVSFTFFFFGSVKTDDD